MSAQDGDCWIYDENSVVFAGAPYPATRVLPCHASSHGCDSCWLDGAESTGRE
jgi:hypothetical protein